MNKLQNTLQLRIVSCVLAQSSSYITWKRTVLCYAYILLIKCKLMTIFIVKD